MHVDGSRRAGEDRAEKESQKALASEGHAAADRVLLEVAQSDEAETEVGGDDPAEKNRRGQEQESNQIEVGVDMLPKLEVRRG